MKHVKTEKFLSNQIGKHSSSFPPLGIPCVMVAVLMGSVIDGYGGECA